MTGQELRGGKATLPRKRREYRETPEVAEAARRLIGALGKRLAVEDPADLQQLLLLDDAMRTTWATAVEGLPSSGFTDREIGRALGTTRQAVEQRWPRDHER